MLLWQALASKQDFAKEKRQWCDSGSINGKEVAEPLPRLTYPSHEGRHDLKILGLLHIEEGERTQEERECCLEGQNHTLD